MVDRLITHVCNRRVPFKAQVGETKTKRYIISFCDHKFFENTKYFQTILVFTTCNSFEVAHTNLVAMPSRACRQRDERKKYENLIVKKMYRRLNTDDHKQRMLTTDQLLPLGSLRRSTVRKIFAGWIKKLVGVGRVVTRKLAKNVVQSLRSKFEIGNDSLDDDEILRMHSLLKVAKKRKLSTAAMSSVDVMETCPMEFPQDCDLGECRVAFSLWLVIANKKSIYVYIYIYVYNHIHVSRTFKWLEGSLEL